jgi:hypothetical protein
VKRGGGEERGQLLQPNSLALRTWVAALVNIILVHTTSMCSHKPFDRSPAAPSLSCAEFLAPRPARDPAIASFYAMLRRAAATLLPPGLRAGLAAPGTGTSYAPEALASWIGARGSAAASTSYHTSAAQQHGGGGASGAAAGETCVLALPVHLRAPLCLVSALPLPCLSSRL